MRDHRAACRAILARHTRTTRRLRAAERVVAALAGRRRPAGALHTPTQIHTHLALTVALSRHLHPAPSTGGATGTPASQRAARTVTTVATRPAPRLHRQRAVSAPGRNAVSRVAATHLRDLTVTTTRTEARVRVVDRVLSRPAASAEPSPAGRPAAGPVDPFHAAPVRPATPPSAPSPAELTAITNHVLTAIDQRLIAHNERRGRG